MTVIAKREIRPGRARRFGFSHSQGIAKWGAPSEWVSERGLFSRDYDLLAVESSAEMTQLTSKVMVQAIPETVPIRTGRGSLRGQLVVADDWDSDEVNSAIARTFGVEL